MLWKCRMCLETVLPGCEIHSCHSNFVIYEERFHPSRAVPLAFHYSNGTHPGYFRRQVGSVNHIYNQIHVLVGVRLFFCQTSPTACSRNDSLAFELFINAASFGMFDRSRAAHLPPRAVTGGSKRLFHAAWLSHEDPAGTSHITRYQYRLSDLAIGVRNLGMVWRESARRAFAPACCPREHALVPPGISVDFCHRYARRWRHNGSF